MTVYASGLLYCKQVFAGHDLNQVPVYLERLFNARNHQIARIFQVAFNEFEGRCGIGRFAYLVGHVNRKEIGSINKTVHIVHVNVVGIHKIRFIVT